MKKCIIIHGSPDEAEYLDPSSTPPNESHFIPWLKDTATSAGYEVYTPLMPVPYSPKYEDWVTTLESATTIGSDTTLVGHSCGGGFILKYLSLNKDLTPDKVILVAPWIDTESVFSTKFFDFEIDRELTKRTEVHVFYSTDDEECVKTFDIISAVLPDATYHIFLNREHFTVSSVPEILDII